MAAIGGVAVDANYGLGDVRLGGGDWAAGDEVQVAQRGAAQVDGIDAEAAAALGDDVGRARQLAGHGVHEVLTALQERCQGRGVHLVEVGGGWQFRTALDLAPDLAVVMEKPRRLPRAAMETLAIIAQCQPLTRAEIGRGQRSKAFVARRSARPAWTFCWKRA